MMMLMRSGGVVVVCTDVAIVFAFFSCRIISKRCNEVSFFNKIVSISIPKLHSVKVCALSHRVLEIFVPPSQKRTSTTYTFATDARIYSLFEVEEIRRESKNQKSLCGPVALRVLFVTLSLLQQA
jgi:hypothetical protein